MASSASQREYGTPTSGLYDTRDLSNRRTAAHALFKEYLLPDNGKKALESLDYPAGPADYLSRVIGYLGMTARSTPQGLEGRPSQDERGTGPASLVESPGPGIAEYKPSMPLKLNWAARMFMSEDESRALMEMGALMRLTAFDAGTLLNINELKGVERDLAMILHSSEKLPQLGLMPENKLTALFRKFGLVATYQMQLTGADETTLVWGNSKAAPKTEIWKTLTTANGLAVYGRVPSFPSSFVK